MDYLQEGIGLRGYGQRDPLVEYQREAFDMFGAMMDGIKEESVGFLFNVEVQIEEAPAPPPPMLFKGEEPQVSGDIGVRAEPVPSGAPAAFTDDVPTQQPQHAGEPAALGASEEEDGSREKVAQVLGQVLGQPSRPAALQYSAPTVDGEGGVTRSTAAAPAGDGARSPGFANVARNAMCPCGSGRKFKRCHGAPGNR
jgi:preprotein translocase subunit SecA